MKKLRIAMFCTNIFATPPHRGLIYSPLWLTYTIAEGMRKRGHNVSLFASSDSQTKTHLVSCNLPSLKKNKKWKKFFEGSNDRWKERIIAFYENVALSRLHQLAQKDSFDIIHIHPAQRAIHFAPLVKVPVVYTLHDPLDWNNGLYRGMYEQYKHFKNIYFVSLSNNQRKAAPNLRYIKTIPNGINVNAFSYNQKGGNYLAAVGRLIPEKGVDQAITLAKKLQLPLRIAGSYSPSSDYWRRNIQPFLGKNIKYVGLLPYHKIATIYRQARITLFPVTNWTEPGALAPLESMACGTPVIAYNKGVYSEIIVQGKTGFVVNSFSEMIEAVKKIFALPQKRYEQMRLNCRQHIENFFTSEGMIKKYEETYYAILKK